MAISQSVHLFLGENTYMYIPYDDLVFLQHSRFHLTAFSNFRTSLKFDPDSESDTFLAHLGILCLHLINFNSTSNSFDLLV